MAKPTLDNDEEKFNYTGSNLFTKIRFWRSTLTQAILAPMLFMILLLLLQQADYANQRISNLNPASKPLEGVVSCFGPAPCINMMFTPDNEKTRSYLSAFARKNSERTREPAFRFEQLVDRTLILIQVWIFFQKEI
jgi:hypothetical protein